MQLYPYQQTLLAKLLPFKRHHNWSDPGTGKTLVTVEWLRQKCPAESVSAIILLAPDNVTLQWLDTFKKAWGKHETPFNWIDARSGQAGCEEFEAWLSDPKHLDTITIFATTPDWLQRRLFLKSKKEVDRSILERVYSRAKVALVVDEAHLIALPTSSRGRAVRALAGYCHMAVELTGTPQGNPKQCRIWGLTQFIAPGLLMRLQAETFDKFKAKFCQCIDLQGRPRAGGPIIRSVRQADIDRLIIAPQQPFVGYVSLREALPELPDKIRLQRFCRMPASAEKLHSQMRLEDRAVLTDDRVIVSKTSMTTKMRSLEIASGWLGGEVVHTAKLELLQQAQEEMRERWALTETDPYRSSFWATRTVTLLAAALAAGGMDPKEAMERVAKIPAIPSPEYHAVVKQAYAAGVGIYHGPVQRPQWERILAAWQAGDIWGCAIHPQKGGPGLNLQHCRVAMYVEQCPGVIQRTQAGARHHRAGVAGTVWEWDLLVEGSAEATILAAHDAQRDAETDLCDWLKDAPWPQGRIPRRKSDWAVSPEVAMMFE